MQQIDAECACSYKVPDGLHPCRIISAFNTYIENVQQKNTNSSEEAQRIKILEIGF